MVSERTYSTQNMRSCPSPGAGAMDQYSNEDNVAMVQPSSWTTGKKVEELTFGNGFALVAAVEAVLAWFAKNFFVGNGPCDAGNGYCQCK